jgi:hypothetical protein
VCVCVVFVCLCVVYVLCFVFCVLWCVFYVLCFVFCGVCFVFCVCVFCFLFCVLCFGILESDKKTKHMKALVVIFDRNVFIFNIQTNNLTQTIPNMTFVRLVTSEWVQINKGSPKGRPQSPSL